MAEEGREATGEGGRKGEVAFEKRNPSAMGRIINFGKEIEHTGCDENSLPDLPSIPTHSPDCRVSLNPSSGNFCLLLKHLQWLLHPQTKLKPTSPKARLT